MSDEYPEFRTVLRGYDPAQVEEVLDEVFAALDDAVKVADGARTDLVRLRTEHENARTGLQRDLERAQARAADLEHNGDSAPASFQNLGTRIGAMLTAADEEAAEIRRRAREEAQRVMDEARAAALTTRAEADHDAADLREKAAALHADAETSTHDRLAELDRSVAGRREQAEADHARLVAEHEAQLRDARARVDAVEAEAAERRARDEAHRERVRTSVREVRDQIAALVGPTATGPAAGLRAPDHGANTDTDTDTDPTPGAMSGPRPAATDDVVASPERRAPRPEPRTTDTPGPPPHDVVSSSDGVSSAASDEADPYEGEPVEPYAFGVERQGAPRSEVTATPDRPSATTHVETPVDAEQADGADESFEGEPWSREADEPTRRRWSLSPGR